MAVFTTLFFNHTLKQFLACKDLNGQQGQALIAKLQVGVKDSLELVLKTIPTTQKPHSDVLKKICQQYLKNDSERFLDNLDNDSTLIRSATTHLLSTTQQISPARLLKRMHDDPASRTEILEILSYQRENLAPELLINNAMKMERQYAIQLIDLAQKNAPRTDMTALVVDIDSIDNPDIKIHLIRFLAAVEKPDAATLICQFVGDPSRVVNMEALKNLKAMKVEFDLGILVQKIPDMDAADAATTMDILSQKISPQTLPRLVRLMVGNNDDMRQRLAAMISKNVTTDSLEKFLLELARFEWWERDKAIQSLQDANNECLMRAASKLVRHEDEFLRNTADMLAAGYQSETTNVMDFVESLQHADWQIRERAIVKLGQSENRKALPLLRNVLEQYPESALTVLRAVTALGYSKGLELALICLKKPEAAIQREALLAMGAIVSSRHAENVRSGIMRAAPKLQATVRDTALQVINEITIRFKLPKLTMADESMFETRLIKIDENQSGQSASVEIQKTAVLETDNPEVADFQHVEQLKPDDYWMERYRIKQEIGRGAMGRVMLVDDETVGETLILKFMHPELTADSNSRERFLRELKYARKISHPNVIRIHDFLLKGGISAISMEYFASKGLDALVKGDPRLSVEQSLDILQQVSDGMYAAHQQDVIHRDLKPSNILVNAAGLAKVVDFGIASASTEQEATLTKTGMIIGTPSYLSPERAKGLEADHRSDIYALGVIAYLMFSGTLPYKGEPISLLLQHIEGKAIPLHRLDKKLPIGVSMLVEKMMAVDIDQRFQSMKDVRDTIEQLK